LSIRPLKKRGKPAYICDKAKKPGLQRERKLLDFDKRRDDTDEVLGRPTQNRGLKFSAGERLSRYEEATQRSDPVGKHGA